jgi:hypothetical protein
MAPLSISAPSCTARRMVTCPGTLVSTPGPQLRENSPTPRSKLSVTWMLEPSSRALGLAPWSPAGAM